jgi:hypothetical protein
MEIGGAGEGNRTPDLLITSEPLCRLSYPGLLACDPSLRDVPRGNMGSPVGAIDSANE